MPDDPKPPDPGPPPPVVEARPYKAPRPPWKERMREWLKPEPKQQRDFKFKD
jgi:hypothetical protein